MPPKIDPDLEKRIRAEIKSKYDVVIVLAKSPTGYFFNPVLNYLNECMAKYRSPLPEITATQFFAVLPGFKILGNCEEPGIMEQEAVAVAGVYEYRMVSAIVQMDPEQDPSVIKAYLQSHALGYNPSALHPNWCTAILSDRDYKEIATLPGIKRVDKDTAYRAISLTELLERLNQQQPDAVKS